VPAAVIAEIVPLVIPVVRATPKEGPSTVALVDKAVAVTVYAGIA
jgi:hypothetical protein